MWKGGEKSMLDGFARTVELWAKSRSLASLVMTEFVRHDKNKTGAAAPVESTL
jgi:hypothetical protein